MRSGKASPIPKQQRARTECSICGSCDASDNVARTTSARPAKAAPAKVWSCSAGIDSWARHRRSRRRRANNLTNNNGGSSGFNYATRLGTFSDVTGIGLQVRRQLSGIYDWSWTSGQHRHLDAPRPRRQQQGLFHPRSVQERRTRTRTGAMASYTTGCSTRHGALLASRSDAGPMARADRLCHQRWNRVRLLGHAALKGDTNLDSNRQPVSTRSINQANLFWHHKWELGADSWLWVGVPQDSRLNPVLRGNLGDFLVGGSVIAPLDDYVSLYGNFQYMHPSAQPGSVADGKRIGLISPRLLACSTRSAGTTPHASTVAGNCWLPLMPVANNGNALVDHLPAGS